MKKLKLFIIPVLSLLLLSNCESITDIDQPGRLSADNAFRSVGDLESGVLGIYLEFDYTPAIQFNSVFTDEISIGVDNGGQGLGGSYDFILNPGSAMPAVQWINYYRAINAANRVITAAAAITPTEGEQARYDNVLGQAYTLRAWAHFELLTYFSPDLTDDAAPGVIAVDFVPTLDQVLPRNTTGEVFAVINSDLDLSDGLLSDESNPTFISLDFNKALRARLNAYRGNYTLADQYAAELLADYPLADRTQYEDMFNDQDNTEIIFKLTRSIGGPFDGQGATGSANAGGWAGANYAFVNGTIDGSPYFEMSRSLFNLFDPNDIRYVVNVDTTSIIDPDYATSPDPANSDILVISKYTGKDVAQQPLLNDLKVFRASEMALIRAEAAVANGDFIAARGFIDDIRDARFGDDQPDLSFNTAADGYAAILQERRIELAFEGFRWVDIKRLGQLAGGVGVDRDAVDCAINGQCTLAPDDYRFTLPIPLVELNANNVISQNDGY